VATVKDTGFVLRVVLGWEFDIVGFDLENVRRIVFSSETEKNNRAEKQIETPLKHT
jgi:hypothetical protein